MVRCGPKYDKKCECIASEDIIIQSQNFYRDKLAAALVPKINVLYRGRELDRFFDQLCDLVEGGCPSQRMSFDRFFQSEVLVLKNYLSAFAPFNKLHGN